MTKKNFTVEEFAQAFQDKMVAEDLGTRDSYTIEGIIKDVNNWEGDDAVDFSLTLEEAVDHEIKCLRQSHEAMLLSMLFGG